MCLKLATKDVHFLRIDLRKRHASTARILPMLPREAVDPSVAPTEAFNQLRRQAYRHRCAKFVAVRWTYCIGCSKFPTICWARQTDVPSSHPRTSSELSNVLNSRPSVMPIFSAASPWMCQVLNHLLGAAIGCAKLISVYQAASSQPSNVLSSQPSFVPSSQPGQFLSCHPLNEPSSRPSDEQSSETSTKNGYSPKLKFSKLKFSKLKT